MAGKATVVTTLPFKVCEDKPGLVPYHFEVPAAPKNDINVLVVHDAHYLQLMPLADSKQPPLKMNVPASEVARSLCEDFISGLIGISYEPGMDDAISAPGLFYVEDEALTVKQIKEQYAARVNQALKNTKRWFATLINMADDDWRATGRLRAVSEMQRYAARYLGLNREWNVDFVESGKTDLCWACKSPVHSEAIVCVTCHAILNEEKFSLNKSRFVNTPVHVPVPLNIVPSTK